MPSSGVDDARERLAHFSATAIFDPDETADLPSPARRYLLHAIQPATPLAGHVHLRMHGQMALKPGGSMLPMHAVQVIAVPHGFVWSATVGPWWSRIVGYDAYESGNGEMQWKLWNIFPIVDASGPDISRSAAGRLAIESIFMPSALLPSQGASWEAVDDSTARVALTLADAEHVLDLTVDNDGRLIAVTMMRWGNQNATGRYEMEPFGTFSIQEEKSFGGYTIPTRLSVGWRPGSDDPFEFFFAEIDHMEFR